MNRDPDVHQDECDLLCAGIQIIEPFLGFRYPDAIAVDC
jgi:hypothetical protein